MKITIVTVGKIKEKYLKDAIAEYTKRLSKYCKLEIVEVADEKTPDNASETVEDMIRSKEDNLVDNMKSQGTTPRQLTDLLASLADLTSGSGDKGTPIILIQNYFKNFSM